MKSQCGFSSQKHHPYETEPLNASVDVSSSIIQYTCHPSVLCHVYIFKLFMDYLFFTIFGVFLSTTLLFRPPNSIFHFVIGNVVSYMSKFVSFHKTHMASLFLLFFLLNFFVTLWLNSRIQTCDKPTQCKFKPLIITELRGGTQS